VTYCTTAELVNLTGSALSTTILTAIIEQGDREIDAYLAPFGVGADASACKSASLELAKAGLIDYSVQHGDRANMLTAGDTTEMLNVDQMIQRYRAAAFGILDRYVSTASASVSKYHIVKVVGR
jgi:hypothetical protein